MTFFCLLLKCCKPYPKLVTFDQGGLLQINGLSISQRRLQWSPQRCRDRWPWPPRAVNHTLHGLPASGSRESKQYHCHFMVSARLIETLQAASTRTANSQLYRCTLLIIVHNYINWIIHCCRFPADNEQCYKNSCAVVLKYRLLIFFALKYTSNDAKTLVFW